MRIYIQEYIVQRNREQRNFNIHQSTSAYPIIVLKACLCLNRRDSAWKYWNKMWLLSLIMGFAPPLYFDRSCFTSIFFTFWLRSFHVVLLDDVHFVRINARCCDWTCHIAADDARLWWRAKDGREGNIGVSRTKIFHFSRDHPGRNAVLSIVSVFYPCSFALYLKRFSVYLRQAGYVIHGVCLQRGPNQPSAFLNSGTVFGFGCSLW